MKELSIEEKAKAYDNALEIAKGLYAKDAPDSLRLERMFPALKESEDERIRENIIATIHLYYGEPLEDEAKEMIAWVEKQGEQKPADTEKGAKGNEKEIPNSAWSEEDEDNFKTLVGILNERMNSCDKGTMTYNVYKKIQDWLKSLKERCAWRPSEEQIKALQESIGIVGELTSRGECLKELVEQLKKLKE